MPALIGASEPFDCAGMIAAFGKRAAEKECARGLAERVGVPEFGNGVSGSLLRFRLGLLRFRLGRWVRANSGRSMRWSERGRRSSRGPARDLEPHVRCAFVQSPLGR